MPYESWQSTDLAPSWLQTPKASALERVLGRAKDIAADAAKQGIKARFPQLAPVDALPSIGADRMLPRYLIDTDETHRARLEAAWDLWSLAGTRDGLLAALGAAGFGHVAITNTRTPPAGYGGTWPPDGDMANWSRFWVLLSAPFPPGFAWAARAWGDTNPATGHAYRWGDRGADGTPFVWGSTATAAQVAYTRAVIRTWKPGHVVCAGIWVSVAGGKTLKWPGK